MEAVLEPLPNWGQCYAMLGALDAILGHRSAHSLATGPFTVEPVTRRGCVFGASGDERGLTHPSFLPCY